MSTAEPEAPGPRILDRPEVGFLVQTTGGLAADLTLAPAIVTRVPELVRRRASRR